MSDALDLGPLDEALDDLIASLDGAEMTDMLSVAAEAMRQQWRANIIGAGEIGDESVHYANSLVISPISRKKVVATVEIAAEYTPEPPPPTRTGKPRAKDSWHPIFYPAVLEYGDSEIVPRPVALQAFESKRRAVVDTIGTLSGRKVTSRRMRTRIGGSQIDTNKAGGASPIDSLRGGFGQAGE